MPVVSVTVPRADSSPIQIDWSNELARRLRPVLTGLWVADHPAQSVFGGSSALTSATAGRAWDRRWGHKKTFSFGNNARLDWGPGWSGRASGAQYGYRGAIIVGRTNGIGSGGFQDWWVNSGDSADNNCSLNASGLLVIKETGNAVVSAADGIAMPQEFSLAFGLGTYNSQYQRVAINGTVYKNSTAAIGDGWSGWTNMWAGSASWPVSNTCLAEFSLLAVLDGPIDMETLTMASDNPWQILRG